MRFSRLIFHHPQSSFRTTRDTGRATFRIPHHGSKSGFMAQCHNGKKTSPRVSTTVSLFGLTAMTTKNLRTRILQPSQRWLVVPCGIFCPNQHSLRDLTVRMLRSHLEVAVQYCAIRKRQTWWNCLDKTGRTHRDIGQCYRRCNMPR